MTVFTRRREKLKNEKHQKDMPESHSCVCAHCGRPFPEEDENGYSDISVDTDLGESEDNSDNS
jgi:hypothetical protein